MYELQFLVHLVCDKADTDLCFNPALGEVEHGTHVVNAIKIQKGWHNVSPLLYAHCAYSIKTRIKTVQQTVPVDWYCITRTREKFFPNLPTRLHDKSYRQYIQDITQCRQACRQRVGVQDLTRI